jgi:hypothetical protein
VICLRGGGAANIFASIEERGNGHCLAGAMEFYLLQAGLMSDYVSDAQKREYLPLIIGYLMTQNVYTHDAETQKEIDRLKAELAEITERLDSE